MDKSVVKKDVSYVGARLREPSTYIGLGVLLAGALHLPNATEWATVIMDGGLALGGVIGICLSEGQG